jgi:WD40 repeat protein
MLTARRWPLAVAVPGLFLTWALATAFPARAGSDKPARAAGVRPLEGHTGSVHRVTFSPDGGQLLSAGGPLDPRTGDSTIRLWDVKTGAELRRFEGHTDAVHGLGFLPDGKQFLSAGNDGTVRLWVTATGRELRRFAGHTEAVYALAVSADGTRALTGGADRMLRLWDVATGKELRRIEVPGGFIRATAFAPDGRTAASGGQDGQVRLWDVAAGRELRRWAAHRSQGVDGLAFAPDGRALASCAFDKAVILWDPATGRELRRFAGHQDSVNAVAISADGRRLLTGSGRFYSGRPNPTGPDCGARLWDVKSGKELARWNAGTRPIFTVAFAPDGRLAAVAGLNRTLVLWDLPP